MKYNVLLCDKDMDVLNEEIRTASNLEDLLRQLIFANILAVHPEVVHMVTTEAE